MKARGGNELDFECGVIAGRRERMRKGTVVDQVCRYKMPGIEAYNFQGVEFGPSVQPGKKKQILIQSLFQLSYVD